MKIEQRECVSKDNPNKFCKLIDYCTCSISALEPDDNCGIHGHPEIKCMYCGRYIKFAWEETDAN